MTRTLRPFLIVAFLAVAGVLAMHGISGHGHGSPASAASASAADIVAMAGHDHDSRGHAGNEPCRTCTPANAAGLCAFMVLAVVASSGRSTNALRARMQAAIRPTFRSWTPDPPVPRLVLVPAL